MSGVRSPARWCGGLLVMIAWCAAVGTLLESDGGHAAAFAVAFVLDVPVAALLYVLLQPIGRRRALAAMVLRLLYAAAALAVVAGLATTGRLDAFDAGLEAVLTIFGLHLGLIGWLLTDADHVPRALGTLVALGGGEYVVTGTARIIDVSVRTPIAAVLGLLALAELALAVSLLRNPGWRVGRAATRDVAPTTKL